MLHTRSLSTLAFAAASLVFLAGCSREPETPEPPAGKSHDHDQGNAHQDGMPAALSEGDEKELYLKPGGIYTEADIKANGNKTASEAFRGLRAKHDMRPKPGDKICPVTMTKANPKFTWTVAGKAYEFCCPPCVDEFVTWAKTEPELILEPESYVKKKQ